MLLWTCARRMDPQLHEGVLARLHDRNTLLAECPKSMQDTRERRSSRGHVLLLREYS